jgi:hypothetical protein
MAGIVSQALRTRECHQQHPTAITGQRPQQCTCAREWIKPFELRGWRKRHGKLSGVDNRPDPRPPAPPKSPQPISQVERTPRKGVPRSMTGEAWCALPELTAEDPGLHF